MSAEAVEFIEIFEALPIDKKLRLLILRDFSSRGQRMTDGKKSLMTTNHE